MVVAVLVSLFTDLNINNHLGFSGRVAGAFFQVISEMNHTASYPVQPRTFKQIVGECNPAFQGYTCPALRERVCLADGKGAPGLDLSHDIHVVAACRSDVANLVRHFFGGSTLADPPHCPVGGGAYTAHISCPPLGPFI